MALAGSALVTVVLQMRFVPATSVPLTILIALAAAAFWGRQLWRRDPGTFDATLGDPRFRLLLLSAAAILFVDLLPAFGCCRLRNAIFIWGHARWALNWAASRSRPVLPAHC